MSDKDVRLAMMWLDRAHLRARHAAGALADAAYHTAHRSVLVALEAQEQAVEAIRAARDDVGGAA